MDLAAVRKRRRGGHVKEAFPLIARRPGLEHETPVRGVARQPVRQRAPRRAAADDDEVVLIRRHGRPHLVRPMPRSANTNTTNASTSPAIPHSGGTSMNP